MRYFIIYNIKYFLTDIYFIIFLALVLLSLFVETALPLQPPDFAVFLVVYLLSVYVERDIGQPMPSLLAARGRLAVAASVYVSTSPALAAAAWRTPLVLLAPLLATLRRRLDLFLPGVAALAVLSPASATAVAVFEALVRPNPIAAMGRGASGFPLCTQPSRPSWPRPSSSRISRSVGRPTWRYAAWPPWPYTTRGF